jgi:hypothetical protein
VVQGELQKFGMVVAGGGDRMHVCAQAGMVQAAMLQAQDGAGYVKWTRVEKITCSFPGSDELGNWPPEEREQKVLAGLVTNTTTPDDLIRQRDLDDKASMARAEVETAKYDQENWPSREKNVCNWTSPRDFCKSEKYSHERKQQKGAEALQWLTENGYKPYH